MLNARAHKLQWSGPTVHSSTVLWVWSIERQFSFKDGDQVTVPRGVASPTI